MENKGQKWTLVFVYFGILILYDYSRFYYYLELLIFII